MIFTRDLRLTAISKQSVGDSFNKASTSEKIRSKMHAIFIEC